MLHDALARGRVTAGGERYPVPGGMLETAENLRREYSIGRAEQDEFSVRSHHAAAAAAAEGRFAEEIIPLSVTSGRQRVTVDGDERIRPDSSVEKLARLRPLLQRDDPEAMVTGGNASGQNDGAAVCIVTTRELAADGLTLADIDLIELNEAFAAQVLACTREWELTDRDFDRCNVNGSGISLGHPVGATGGRILATLANEMRRRNFRYGLETMCIGGGQGLAAIFENCAW
jgi:acetyl-CoA C-acetyltransferase